MFGKSGGVRGADGSAMQVFIDVALPIVLISLDYAEAGARLILSRLFTVLFVALAEELATRGFVVRLRRNTGAPEYAVGLVSAGAFADVALGQRLHRRSGSRHDPDPGAFAGFAGASIPRWRRAGDSNYRTRPAVTGTGCHKRWNFRGFGSQ
ncbi:hypothetical protein [Schumannella soli]|uniref:CPBP family intramembrane metalloprotease n=1 Tax=Schumannella soli TaxID=2590779 RepID=A0A506Y881_9MICO|nr:hypothetical protein [Schumannella soli]TPW78093.1 hypothetical protein FJ657_05560 [Schumannella soli]